ncbi:MAG: nucleoside 2-deoxyribosyltransferase, partial [Pseudonocardiaceae bacterium]
VFYVAHRLFAAHDRVLGAMIAQQLGTAVGMNKVFLPFCDTDEEDLVAEVKGRRLFELDRQRLAGLDGMLAVLHGPSLDDGVCMEIGYAAALSVPIVVVTTDFQTYGTSEHGAALHFPDALVQAVVTEIVRIDHLAPPVDDGTRFEAFRDRNLGQLATAVNLAVDCLVHHSRSSSTRRTAASGLGPFAVCERSPHYTDAIWARMIRLLGNGGYRVHQSERFGAAIPVRAAGRDWRALLGAGCWWSTPAVRKHRAVPQ